MTTRKRGGAALTPSAKLRSRLSYEIGGSAGLKGLSIKSDRSGNMAVRIPAGHKVTVGLVESAARALRIYDITIAVL